MMPVGAAGAGWAMGVSASGSVFVSGAVLVLAVFAGGVVTGNPPRPGVGLTPGTGAAALVIATNASDAESGDQTIVSGKWTAIASEVIFLTSLPSGEYRSIRNSDWTSVTR